MRRAGWENVRSLAATLVVGLAIGACSAPGEDLRQTHSAQSISGRWIPSADAKEAGAKVRIAYESPPAWKGTKGCGGKLLAGSARLGAYLQDKYDAISSIGGYACRPNTANKRETSVHGTGRALDIMIPTTGGQADNGAGDPIANWLVTNADRIGIQLMIWDHSVWHCDGRNDTPYTGPIPHVDHIHAELTKEAAAMQTPWFADSTDDDTTVVEDDAGADTGADATDTDTTDTDTNDTDVPDDPGFPDDDGDPDPPPPASDAGTTGTTPPAVMDAGAPDAAPTKSTPPVVTTDGTAPPDLSDDSHDDGPGATQSIPRSTKASANDSGESGGLQSSGCSTSSRSSRSPGAPDAAWALALVGAAVVLRRRRR